MSDLNCHRALLGPAVHLVHFALESLVHLDLEAVDALHVRICVRLKVARAAAAAATTLKTNID